MGAISYFLSFSCPHDIRKLENTNNNSEVKKSNQQIRQVLVIFLLIRYSIEAVLPYTCFIFQDDSNRSLLSEKKFSKECIRCCVLQNKTMSSIEVGENDNIIVMFHNLGCSTF